MPTILTPAAARTTLDPIPDFEMRRMFCDDDTPPGELRMEPRMNVVQVAGGLAALLVGLLCAPGLGLGAAITGKVVFAGPVPVQKRSM